MSEPTDNLCPRCGAFLPAISGMCAACLARGAMENQTGWLAALASVVPDDQPSLPGWRIIGTLGAGGMGRVYQAESEDDGMEAAVKVLDRRWSDHPAMVARFEKEARLLQSLQHPNIVRHIASAETDDGRLCLITELVAGCDLGRLLRAEKLSHERAMDIFGKVCAAVQHAHEQGLVHRDIKPSNILIGKDGEVKLADFGLAREMTPGGGDASLIGGLTATTDQFGTAYYLAPERMISTKPAGPEADVYSLGVLLYHLLTGQMPLGRYLPISQLADLPRELDGITSQALAADPAQRTQKVAEFQAQVSRLWQDHRAGTLRARRLRRVLAIVSGVVLLIGGIAGGAWWQNQRMTPKPIIYRDPTSATQADPWDNSLGMKFVPVVGTKVLFSVYETRRRDADTYMAAAGKALDLPWLGNEASLRLKALNHSLVNLQGNDGEWTNFSYADPGWPVTPEHPVIFVSALDAYRMCQWLTWKEQGEGRLKPHQRYRLPTDAEWLTACGGEDAVPRPGNLAGPEAREGLWPLDWPTLAQADPFPRTAPVGSFPMEGHGLYDLSGNVAEWTNSAPKGSTEMTPQEARRFVRLRGPAYSDGTPDTATFSFQRTNLPLKRVAVGGFRMVLEIDEPLDRSADP